MNNRVFLVAGGSGGHLFPALSVYYQLKDYDTLFLTDNRTEQYLKKLGMKYRKIFTARLQINFFLIFNLLKLTLSIFDNIALILKKKPDIIIGFGGYTGIPLRKKKRISNFKTRKKRIFIVGGSQGAKIFSKIIPELVKKFDKSLLKKLIIIQQVRDDDLEEIKEKYQALKVEHKIENFFYNIYEQYYNADLIISRCGASTLAEIEIFSKPCLLFPLPSSMNNHQYYNAKEFEKNNRCLILDETNLCLESLSKKVEKLIFLEKKKKKLYSIKNNIQKISFTDLMKRVAN